MSALFSCASALASLQGKPKRVLIPQAVRFIKMASRCADKFHLLKVVGAAVWVRVGDIVRVGVRVWGRVSVVRVRVSLTLTLTP